MVTEIIRPDGDGGINEWSFCSHNPHYLGINEVILDTAGHITGSEPQGDDNDREEFTFTTFDDIEDNSITQVIVKTNVMTIQARKSEVTISWDNGVSWDTPQDLATANGENTNTFSGFSYSKADLDKFEVKYICDCPTKGDLTKIYRSYVIVTYALPVGGYTHKVLGVASADIAEVLGVAAANIGEVNGV